jgi:hypothetical protein
VKVPDEAVIDDIWIVALVDRFAAVAAKKAFATLVTFWRGSVVVPTVTSTYLSLPSKTLNGIPPDVKAPITTLKMPVLTVTRVVPDAGSVKRALPALGESHILNIICLVSLTGEPDSFRRPWKLRV